MVATIATPRASATVSGDRRAAHRRGPSGTEEASTRPVDQRRRQPSHEQPDAGGTQTDKRVLEQQHDGDQPRRAPDGFQQADPARLLGHPAADQHDHARDRQQGEEPTANREDRPHLGERLRVAVADLLPGDQVRGGRRWVRVVVGGELFRTRRIVEPEVHEVGLRAVCPGDVHSIGLGGPHQAGVVRGHPVGQEAPLSLPAGVRVRGDRGGDRDPHHVHGGPAEVEPITDPEPQRAREAGLDDDSARSDPTPA